MGELLRLIGYEAPWERALYEGRELLLGKTLEECGLPKEATVVTVRTALVAEGWQILKGEDADSDTDEEDF